MKSVSESMKEVENKKSHLQEQVDQLNEDCARLKAQGNGDDTCSTPGIWEFLFCFYHLRSFAAEHHVIKRSWVEILLGAKLRDNLGQVVYTYVLLLPGSITWYRPRGGDAVRLGR